MFVGCYKHDGSVNRRDDSCLSFYSYALGNYEHVKINHLCNYLIHGPSVKGCKRLKKNRSHKSYPEHAKYTGHIINYDRFYTLLASVRDLITFIC